MIKRNFKSGRYKVKYELQGRTFEGWFTVADLTSLTREDEHKRHTGQGPGK